MNTIKYFFIAATLLLTSSLFATSINEDPKAGTSEFRIVANSSQSVFNLIYLAGKEEAVKINIIDGDGDRIHSEVIKTKDGFIKPFNFSRLPYGSYKFELITGDQKLTEVVSFTKAGSPAAAAKIVQLENRKVKLLVEGNGEASVNVRIYDRRNNLVYEDVVEGLDGFGQDFDFKKFGTDLVTFTISDESGVILSEQLSF